MAAYLSIQMLMLLAVTELVFTSGLHGTHTSAPRGAQGAWPGTCLLS